MAAGLYGAPGELHQPSSLPTCPKAWHLPGRSCLGGPGEIGLDLVAHVLLGLLLRLQGEGGGRRSGLA